MILPHHDFKLEEDKNIIQKETIYCDTIQTYENLSIRH